jgi:hypothetical protein
MHHFERVKQKMEKKPRYHTKIIRGILKIIFSSMITGAG